ncbi:MAG: tetratricopeptide repeat protein [Bacteroidia bacterium]|nr:tetratricopeptide repeat protein [Bacteroidia bacterium]MDW8348507.1 tetratricopeptide repeat protein [Bacteroidia bacterium]
MKAEERLKTLLDFLNQDPNDTFTRYAIATEYNNMGDLDTAQMHYEYLLEHHPDYVGTYYHLGKLYEKKGLTQKAVEIYQKGMRTALNAKNMHAYSELQTAYRIAAGLEYDE